MQLQALWTRLPGSKEKQFLAEIIKDAGRCSAQARQSLWGLRQSAAAPVEFGDKLAALARHAAQVKPVSLALRLEPVSLASMPETEYQLLRIAQEAISNALAHAGAQTLEIRLETEKGTLRLSIEDDGIGFEAGNEASFGHYGLVGMRERAEEIGAKLTIDSSRRSGTCISIELPLSQSEISASNVEGRFEHQTK
jgi:signal transduction histidine kinase